MMKSSKDIVEKIDLANVTTYQAGIAQAAMHRNVQKISNQLLKPYGISKMHWMIIGLVKDSGKTGIRVSDLAKTLDVTIPYLTNTLHILEGRGFVKRSQNTNDSRSKLVHLNSKFLKQCDEIEKILRDGLRKSVYSQVSPEEFRVYMKVVFKLQSAKK